MAKSKKVEKFPVYVRLKDSKKYGAKTVCNGITLSCNSKTLITSEKMLSKIAKVSDYIIIEEVK